MVSNLGKVRLVTLQSTSLCNLNCSYCYLSEKARATRDVISPETVRKSVELIANHPGDIFGKNIKFLWHAGEPLTLPIEKYEEFLGIINDQFSGMPERKVEITHGFQTNGTLIDERWCQFFKKHKVSLGVSLDGPQFINDRHRVTRSSKGSFDSTLRGIELLREHGLPINILAVLTDYSLDFPVEMFDFFRQLHIKSVAFNMEEADGHHGTSSLATESSQKRYKEFMKKFWNLHVASEELPFIVREFRSMSSMLLEKESVLRSCSESSETDIRKPLSHITVSHNGDFSFFCPELLTSKSERFGDFVVGNVHTTSLEEALCSEKVKKIQAEIFQGTQACKESCKYFSVCGGGFPSNKHAETGRFDTTETFACKFRVKYLADAVIENLLEKASPANRAP
jgi:uncharacterized protein